MGASVWRVERTTKGTLGERCGGLDGGKCLESGTNNQRVIGRRMWRTGWGQVSGEWDEQPKGPWEKDVEDWMGASCLESGTNNQRVIGRTMWRIGWGQVSGEWDEQQKIG